MKPLQRWWVVTIFATAMGYLEAAVVLYLRTIADRLQPYQPNPIPDFPTFTVPELAREAATLVMLATVGCLAGMTWRGRVAFALLAFGIWDLTYYLFLIPLTGWPNSLLDWDLLFLLPLPWWGPVAAPVSIAILMIAFGLLATVLEQADQPIWPRPASLLLCALGIGLALYLFMASAIAAWPGGETAIRAALPAHFPWRLFALAWLAMAAPILDMLRQFATRYR